MIKKDIQASFIGKKSWPSHFHYGEKVFNPSRLFYKKTPCPIIFFLKKFPPVIFSGKSPPYGLPGARSGKFCPFPPSEATAVCVVWFRKMG